MPKMLPNAQRPTIDMEEQEGAATLHIHLTCDYPGYHFDPEKIVPRSGRFEMQCSDR